jgi:NAD(P)-dependent dehydrogenase (short-subunit alcohol dehydrogenase family)
VELTGRACLVTGAAQGIGAAIATALTSRGARVLLGDVQDEKGRAVAEGLPGALATHLDVTDPESVASAVELAATRLGGLDVLVNNAGIGAPRGIDELDEETWRRTLETNLSGPYRTTRAALPHLRASRGRVVNVSSLSAHAWTPLLAHYSASKAGVMALSETLRIELARDGVGVTTVYFGWIDTPLLTAGTDDPRITPGLRRSMRRAQRLHIAPMRTPAQAAAAVVRGIEQERRAVFEPRRVALAHVLGTTLQRILEPQYVRDLGTA